METQILNVKTLGTFEILKDGRPVRLEPAKHKALVAYLCINKGRSFLRTQLADLLWQNSSEEKGKHSLNQAIYSLRRTLPELVVIHRDTIACNSRVVRTDVEEVMSHLKSGDLTSAFSGMKGPFLEDVDIRNAPDFENWKSDFNRQFYQRNEQIVETLIRETPQSRMRHIEIPAHILGRFHSLDQILAAPTQDIKEPAVAHTSSERPPFCLPFTGRDKHLAQLAKSLQACKEGNPAYAIIAGQPGHGKTRLVEEFLLSATGVCAFRVRCYDAERRIGFGPIVDLLTKCISIADLSTLQPIWRRALGELAPGKFSVGFRLRSSACARRSRCE